MNRYPGRNVSDKEDFNMRFGGRLAEAEDLGMAIRDASGLLDPEGEKAVDRLEEAAGLAKRLSVEGALEVGAQQYGDLKAALVELREDPSATEKIEDVTRVVVGSIPSSAQLSGDLAMYLGADGDAAGAAADG